MFITSFSEQGFEQYGRRFLDTWSETNQPFPLAVYGEVAEKPENLPDNAYYQNLLDIEGVSQIIGILGQHDAYRGMVPISANGEIKYSWRFDAFKFFRKVMVIKDAYDRAKRVGAKHIAWVDADVEFIATMPKDLPRLVLPLGVPLAYIGRKNMHSECGFMLFEVDNPGISRFMGLYWSLYVTGAFSHLREWHDCYVFDHVREMLLVPGYSLSGEECTDLYPWDDTILADWMLHHKGPERKAEHYGTGAVENAVA